MIRLSLRVLAAALMVLLAAAGASAEEGPKAFAAAAGFGSETAGGRGGQIVRVRSLAAAGPGTLRAALETRGARVVVFEVGGVIDLAGKDLTVREPLLTVAGQTAPGPGITLIRGGLRIQASDVVIQHLRVRPGDAGREKNSGWSPDGIGVANPEHTPGIRRVVIDHCSATWAVDENLSVSGPRHAGREGTSGQVTISNCIIAEGLRDSSHEKGAHSMGSLIHDHVRDVTLVGNLYASNMNRNPMLKPDAAAVVVNNLIYNPGARAVHFSWPTAEYAEHPDTMKGATLVAVGNVLWHGPDTPAKLSLVSVPQDRGEVFVEDNIVLDLSGKALEVVSGKPKLLTERPLWPEGLTAAPAEQVAERVLATAGAWPRDAIDARIAEGVRDRTGRVIDSQQEAGGYPQIEPVHRALGLPANPQADDDGDGYTNLDEWLARLAEEVMRPGRN